MEKCGYDVNFVDNLPEYLTCVICQLALRNPVLLVNCGHRICNPCFESMKEHAARTNIELLCPHDRLNVDVNKVVEDKGINRVVLDLNVRCKYYVDDCHWTGELRNLEAHLQGKCRFMENERTHKLLKKLQDRLDTCEMGLKENKKEISAIKYQLCRKDEEITILKELCKHSGERIVLLDKKVEHYCKQSIEKNTASEFCLKFPDVSENSINQFQFEKLDKEIKSLKQNVDAIKDGQKAKSLQVDIMKQLISNKKVVYKWKLKKYTYWKNNSVKYNSPNFYSGVQGHCCKLSLLYHKEKGCIGIFFQLCDGIYDTEISEPFTSSITFEATDKNGNMQVRSLTSVQTKDIDLKTNDFGYADFLKMPRLTDFIIDDSIIITCTLIPE